MQKTDPESYGNAAYDIPPHPEKPTRSNSDAEQQSNFDASSVDHEALTGVSKVEAAQAVWNGKMKWVLFFGLGLASYIYSLDGTTTWQYLAWATSSVFAHSVSGTITAANGIIIACGKPLMAKLADVFGRGETYVFVAVLYAIGYIIMASAQGVGALAGGSVVYSFGYTGLQLLSVIVIADMTTLRFRGFGSSMLTLPFVINSFVSAEIAQGVLSGAGWRWGYGMFAIMVPVCLVPIIGTLLWAQNKAKKEHRIHYSRPSFGPTLHREAGVGFFQHIKQLEYRGLARSGSAATFKTLKEMDIVGLILLATSLALILLPLGLAKRASQGWQTPSMIVMIVIGFVLFPVFVIYELKVPENPVMPFRWCRNKSILAACLIGFFDFVSFYLQYTYLYSFIAVTHDWSYRYQSYFSSTQTLALTIFGIAAGVALIWLRRFKWLLFGGLLIRLLGCGLMIHSRGARGSTGELVMNQVLQGMGGGIAATCIQLSAQASVAHKDVATVTAVVLLITEVGNSVGSAIATAIWTNTMPQALADNVPTTNATLLAELYGNIGSIALYPLDDPIRVGSVNAYEHVMKILTICATAIAVIPPIVCFFLTADYKLTDTQNAYDGKDLTGKSTGQAQEDETVGNVIGLTKSRQ